MSQEIHDRARKLITVARVEGISARDREWLDGHLAACSQCAGEASAVAASIQLLRGVPVVASPETVRRTRAAVRERALEMQAQRASSVPLWIAVMVATISMIVTAPYVWWTFAWLGRVIRVPDPAWQVAFLMWWFLPASVLAAAAAFRRNYVINE
ncbi:MAG: hypothetical protein HY646_00800 [Acidobacteria bacterium]|nr:hypothetical protein [Acidobacteriota bacterium]